MKRACSRKTTPLPSRSDAMKRNVLITASVVKYSLTPSHEKNVRPPGSYPASNNAFVRVYVSKSTGGNVRSSGSVIPASSRQARFQVWVAGWSTSKTRSIPPG